MIVIFGPPEAAFRLLDRLNGRIYLVRGNHDKVAEHRRCRDRFEWVKDYHYFSVEKQKIVLCHYAMRSWRSSRHGTWMLHGHSHGKLPVWDLFRTMDVGTDCNGFFPVLFDNIKLRMDQKPVSPYTNGEDD